MCASRLINLPFTRRSPSHTPSPSAKPESKTDTTALSRGKKAPFT